MTRLIVFLVLALAAVTAPAHGQDQVAPSGRVRTSVLVREAPSTQSAILDRLEPGETVELIGQQPAWYQVRLPDGRIGFVSKLWTVVVEPLAGGGEHRVHLIDVGTGLAIFVEGPDFTLLYDAGSNDDGRTGRNNRALAYLRSVRPDLARIEHMVLSHAHRDHISLLPDIFDAFQIGTVWDSGRAFDTCGYRTFLLRVAAEPNVTYRTAIGENSSRTHVFEECEQRPNSVTVQLGPRMTRAPVRLGRAAQMTVVHIDPELHEDPNENSVVVRLDLAGHRILIMGDAEGGARRVPAAPPDPGSVEEELLDCCRRDIAAQILVAGHHGSMTSSRSTFLQAVGARDFLISSGPTRYSGTSLPDAAVLEEFQRRGRVWRTDLDDSACRVAPAKIGTDSDGRAGGCDNIVIRVVQSGTAAISYNRIAD